MANLSGVGMKDARCKIFSGLKKAEKLTPHYEASRPTSEWFEEGWSFQIRTEAIKSMNKVR